MVGVTLMLISVSGVLLRVSRNPDRVLGDLDPVRMEFRCRSLILMRAVVVLCWRTCFRMLVLGILRVLLMIVPFVMLRVIVIVLFRHLSLPLFSIERRARISL